MSDPPRPLTLPQAAALLQSAARALRSEAEALGEEGTRWHRAPGEWCVNEVIGHLLEAERRGFAGQIRLILEEPGRDLGTWDQEQVARERRDCERSGTELLAEFEAGREESVRLVLSLTPEQLSLSGEHPDVGTLRVLDVLHEWPHHDRAHLMQVLSNVQARVWPHMGNTQRFSEID